MKTNLHHYRLAGVIGGLLLASGQFWGPACLLQIVALLPLMMLILKDRRIGPAALCGFYMGTAYTIPQMAYLLMPTLVTAILWVWITLLLVLLCIAIAYYLPKHPVLGPLTVGAAWYILDWVNYTAIPIWGMAQSFARSWTAYPFAIQFISITGISGVLSVIAALQGSVAHLIMLRGKHNRGAAFNPLPPSAVAFKLWRDKSGQAPFAGGEFFASVTIGTIVLMVAGVNMAIWFQRPTGTITVAAAGWVFDDRSSEIDPHKDEGFEKLFAEPAREAAAKGARIFTTGEMGFYIAKHEWGEWMNRFSVVAQDNNLWLVVGYFNIDIDENRLFFMSPEGQIIHEYTKTHLTPFEPGHKGNGYLKTIRVDGLTIGAMICQDDNFSKRTRHYGNLKADLVLCPTADWWTIKDAHLQAIRARAIECNYGIVRGAACGVSAVISPRGQVLAKRDHYSDGPGYVIGDIPVYRNKTFFSRFGYWPSLVGAGMCIGLCGLHWRKEKRRSLA